MCIQDNYGANYRYNIQTSLKLHFYLTVGTTFLLMIKAGLYVHTLRDFFQKCTSEESYIIYAVAECESILTSVVCWKF